MISGIDGRGSYPANRASYQLRVEAINKATRHDKMTFCSYSLLSPNEMGILIARRCENKCTCKRLYIQHFKQRSTNSYSMCHFWYRCIIIRPANQAVVDDFLSFLSFLSFFFESDARLSFLAFLRSRFSSFSCEFEGASSVSVVSAVDRGVG